MYEQMSFFVRHASFYVTWRNIHNFIYSGKGSVVDVTLPFLL